MARRPWLTSAKDGRFVSKRTAQRNPDMTCKTRISTSIHTGKK